MAAKRKKITKKQAQESERKPFIPNVEVHPEIDEGPFDDDGLSVRQRLFVAALAGPSGGNQGRAAEMAGYRSDNRNALYATASRLLRSVKVKEALSRALARRRATPEWAKEGLIELASSSMANFIVVDDKGEASIDFEGANAAGALGQLKEYREEGIGTGDGTAHIIKRSIKVHDRTAALGILLKLHGLLKDREDEPRPTAQIEVRPMSGGNLRKPANDKPDAGGES